MIITKEFKSDNTKDHIEIIYFVKSHKANIYIKQFDEFTENIKLIGKIIEDLKNSDIKWLCTKMLGSPHIPENTVWFENNKNGDICCHIEDYEKFYLKNILIIIKLNTVYVEEKKTTYDGWVKISNKKTLRKQKMDEVENQVGSLTGNWTTF
jgi:hypothetical protein